MARPPKQKSTKNTEKPKESELTPLQAVAPTQSVEGEASNTQEAIAGDDAPAGASKQAEEGVEVVEPQRVETIGEATRAGEVSGIILSSSETSSPQYPPYIVDEIVYGLQGSTVVIDKAEFVKLVRSLTFRATRDYEDLGIVIAIQRMFHIENYDEAKRVYESMLKGVASAGSE